MTMRACLALALIYLAAGCGDDQGDARPRGPGDASGSLDGGRGRGDLDAGVRGDDGDAGDGAVTPGADAATPVGREFTDRALESALLDKLIACTLLPIGLEVPASAEIHDDTDRCIARCNLAAACPDIEAFACDDAAGGSAFATCLAACPVAPADGFVCGDGQRVAHLAVCDGEPDCEDGADEADCVPTCGDGSTVEGLAISCDGNEDCQDGSDEAGCLLCGS